MELVSNNSYHYVDVCISCVYAGVDGLDLVLKSRQHPATVPKMLVGAYQRHLAMTPADANLGRQYFMNHE